MAERSDVERTLYVIATTWGLLWLVTILATLTSQSNLVRNLPLAYLVLAIEALILVVLFFFGRKSITLVTVVVISGALINNLNVNQYGGAQVQLLTTTWINVASIVIAFISPSLRVAIQRVLMLAGTSGLLLVLNQAPFTTLNHAKHFIILPVVYSAAVGLAVSQGANSMRRAIFASEDQSQSLALAYRAEAQASAHAEEVRLVSRLLHDTVINTLGAIRKGVASEHVGMARERCASNLRDIRQFVIGNKSPEERSLSQLRDAAVQDARVLGLEVSIAGDFSVRELIPSNIFTTAIYVIRELLTNVQKHSGTQHADVHFEIVNNELRMSVTDSGVGYATDGSLKTGGLAQSVFNPIEALDGQVEFVSNTDAGTSVRVSIPLACTSVLSHHEPESISHASENSFDIASRTSWPLLGLATFEASLFMSKTNVVGNLSALFILVGVVVYLRCHRENSVRYLETCAAMVAIVAVISLPIISNRMCRADVAESWGVDGAAALIVMIGLLGPQKFVPIASAIAVVLGLMLPVVLRNNTEGCMSSVLAVLPIEIGTVIAVFAFRTQLLRLWQNTLVARESLMELERTSARNRAIDLVRGERLNGVIQALEPLLEGISTGAIDLQDVQVQETAGRSENTLRSLLLLDHRLGLLGDAITLFVTEAFQHGLTVRVISGEFVPEPSERVVTRVRQLLTKVLKSLPAKTEISLGLFERQGHTTLTLVFMNLEADRLMIDYSYAELDVVIQRSDDEVLMEVSWQE